ncbi:PREDICTED: facilitated trehalose transporter Tret1-like [Papilio polytes]|uniref:facilitated trehalose transporter Tret1-like n=1 Tax=Papilio polytes TaxID=76194 RepID=UPI000676A3B0|nr:PREDICTED: facilitated trehalose transporter Tret1-like [Papilio polytes]
MFAVIIVVTGIPILLLPESPYFLYNKGQEKEAIKVLKFLHGSEHLALQEVEEYTLSSKQEKVNKIAVLKNPTVRKSLLISVIFSIGSQMVGYNAVSYYLQTILISTHTSIMPEIASVVIGIIQFVSSFLTMFTTDRFGRKIILISSLVGMTIGLIGLGTFFKLKPPNSEPVSGFLNILPLISLVIVVYCYNAGIGSLIWATVTELFDGPARAFGVAVNLGVNTTLIFLTTKYFPILISEVGPAITYWSFAVVSILLCLFIIFFLPETKGKSFGEIQDDIAKKTKEEIEEAN